MPTYEAAARFFADFEKLSEAEKAAFRDALAKFVADLRAGRGFRNGLRVKGVKGAGGVYEMTWADDGRATLEYGESRADGEAHVIWRRVGTHAIFKQP